MRSQTLASWTAVGGLVALAACGDGSTSSAAVSSAGETIDVDTALASCCVDLTRSPMGTAFASWLEPDGVDESGAERHRLRVARLGESRATPSMSPQSSVVTASADLFVNWADFPRIVALSDADLIVTYLERISDGPYDYGVRFACTEDGGATWSAPRWLHDHVGPGEHGFVSLARADERTAIAVWLDGRDVGGGHDDHGAARGSMGLRMRSIAIDGELGPEALLDPRVCDCCQTDVARGTDGAWLVAYRDRSEDEVRDVKVVRVVGDRADLVFDSADQWRFDGCPVNGPALASRGNQVAVAWFTPGEQATGVVHCALSGDGGATFDRRSVLDANDVAGRVELQFEREKPRLHALWLGDADPTPQWRHAAFAHGESADVVHRALAPAADGRDGGFARASVVGEHIVVGLVQREPVRVVLRRFQSGVRSRD